MNSRIFSWLVMASVIMPYQHGTASELITDIFFTSAILYSGATPAEKTNWSTQIANSDVIVTARHVAVASSFRLYGDEFNDPEAYGLNINNASLVDIMSPFFKDPTGTNFEFDVDRGDAEWTLSYYESRGPRETDYGRTSRNCRPVASYAWGTVTNVQLNGDTLVLDLLFDPGLVDGSASFGDAIGAIGWHVIFNLATTSGTGEVISHPVCLDEGWDTNGYSFSIQTTTSRLYAVYYTEDLSLASEWTLLTNNVSGTGEEFVFSDSEAVTQRYYRVGATFK